ANLLPTRIWCKLIEREPIPPKLGHSAAILTSKPVATEAEGLRLDGVCLYSTLSTKTKLRLKSVLLFPIRIILLQFTCKGAEFLNWEIIGKGCFEVHKRFRDWRSLQVSNGRHAVPNSFSLDTHAAGFSSVVKLRMKPRAC